MEKVVLRIEPLHAGFLVFKGGGSAELAYACRTRDDVKALIDETYGEDVCGEQRMLPPALDALRERAELEDSDPSLNNGGVVP